MHGHQKFMLRLAIKRVMSCQTARVGTALRWRGIGEDCYVQAARRSYGGDDRPLAVSRGQFPVRRIHGPWFRRVLASEMRSGFVIVRQERLHMPIQRGFV